MPKPTTGKPSKSDFIRANPTLPPAEVVAKGKAEGITFSRRLVSKVRESAAKSPAPTAAKAATPAATPKPQAKKAPAKKAPAKKAGPKAARAKPGRKPATGEMSASDFVRSLPGLSPKEIVAKGAERGLKFSRNLVYMVRSKAGSIRKAAATAAPARRGPGRPPGRPARAAASANGEAPEAVFARLIIEHGIGRVREFLAGAEARVERVLSGAG